MYVVDITRGFDNNDMLVGNDSMDAKAKTINYVMDYVMVNYNLSIDRSVLDQNLDMNEFSLNQFLKENYSIMVDKNLLVQSIPVDKKHCLFLKYSDDKTTFPVIYSFHKKEIKYAQNVLKFLVNDALINKYQDNLSEYEKLRIKDSHSVINITYPKLNISCNIVSLYSGGLFLEELLNNSFSLNQLQKQNSRRLDI